MAVKQVRQDCPGDVEIRMLGRLQVRRVDGTPVDPREWRTAKTADLLRLLALRADRPTDPQLLLDTLWPSVEPVRGRASLRTAACQIRHVLGPAVLEREPSGLRLRHVWVDVEAFRALTRRVRVLIELRQWAQVPRLAREAEALYRDDLTTSDPAAEWALTDRRSLADAHQSLLVDAAEAARQCGHPREAVALAERAVDLDPFDERASRLIMQANLDMGQTPWALREYQRCRDALSDELGVDPSPQTTGIFLTALQSGIVPVAV